MKRTRASVGSDVIQAVMVVAELTGTEMSAEAVEVLLADLAAYPKQMVLDALVRCRREVKAGRFCFAEVMARLNDGHPGIEQAWAIVSRAEDPAETIVWTEEIAYAYGQCRALMADGEQVAARMAFKEAYGAALDESRLHQRLPKWTPALGTDLARRATALEQAEVAGLISRDQRLALAPPDQATDEAEVDARERAGQKLLTCDPNATKPDGSPITVADRIAELKASVKEGSELRRAQAEERRRQHEAKLAAAKAEAQQRVDEYMAKEGR